jgi:CheY-like chemotaxis protein
VRVVLISWSPDTNEAVEHLRPLAEEVDVVAAPDLEPIADDSPDAVVIDLGAQPSEGLALGIRLRREQRTRHIPQVFAGGDPGNVERVRAVLPDAHYADWEGIATQLRTAIERPPENPVVPEQQPG